MRMARGLNLGIGELRVLIVSKSKGQVGRVERMVRMKLADQGWCQGPIWSDLTFALSVAEHQSKTYVGRR